MRTIQPSLDDAYDALKQGRVEDALHLWRDYQESKGICDIGLCDHSSYYWTCCASHFQGRLLSSSLSGPGEGYFELSRKLGKWIDEQNAQQAKGGGKGVERLKIPDELMIGHPSIDRDHQNLIKIINDISVALVSGKYEKCARLLNDFFELAKKHFHKEEKILKEVGFPELAEHQETHHRLLAKSKDFTKMVSKLGESALARERFYTELVLLLYNDALKLDLVFKLFLMKRGVHT